jgi:chaperonin GroEL
MSRQILKGDAIRQAVLRGVNTLADAVTCTLGPKGRNVILERNPLWPPAVTKDGVTVAKEVRDLADPWENAGANLIREAASKTSDQAGDGTTTATLLAQVIYQKGLEALSKGANPVALKRGIDAAVAVVVEHVKSIAQPVGDDETIARVGTISSNGDRAIGELIANAMSKVGRDGIITIAESPDADTTLQVVEGMQIDRGWLAAPFVTDPERLESVLENPYILITERKLFTVTPELDVLLGEVGKQGRPVLVVAGDYEQPFVISLIHNMKLGVLQSLVVKAPSFGDERRLELEDLAIATGGFAFTENCGRSLDSITIEDLGQAQRVISHGHDSAGYTTIIGSKGDKDLKEARVTLLRSLIGATENDYQRELMRRRLARLASGVAIIKVGGVTDGERQEKRDRVDDAVCATRAAVEEGIVPGGGMALIQSMDAVMELLAKHMATDDTAKGMLIIYDVLRDPLLKICANAGEDGSDILNSIVRSNGTLGYNAATGQYEDLVLSGVIDPAKVVRCALQNAASVAALLLTTEAMVSTIPEKK